MRTLFVVLATTFALITPSQASTGYSLSHHQQFKRPTSNLIITEPLALLAGAINIEVDIPTSHSWTVSPSFFHFDPQGTWLFDVGFTGIGARANYFFGNHHSSDSFMFGIGADIIRVQATIFGFQDDAVGVLPDIVWGYQWSGQSFAVRTGLGYSAITPLLFASVGFRF